MTAQLRAELLKLRSTRTTLGLVLGMLALILLLVLVGGLTMDAAKGMVERISKEVLTNPVIEEFTYRIEE